jgi:NDP-sugar pyrophosphorylase family protein
VPPTHALVLAAGLGTRLRPLTEVRAKPAIPVAGTPLIRRIVGWLVENGVTDIVVNVHHLPATVTAVLGDGSDLGARVRFSWEQPAVLGSAGGPRQALDILGADRFLIINGDTLTDVDLVRLSDAHQESGALVTLALTPNPAPHRYGGVRIDRASRIVGFVSRGSGAPEEAFHFIGVQIVEARAFADLPQGHPASSIGGLYDTLIAARPGALGGFVSEAAFWDVGTVDDYVVTSRTFVGSSESPFGASVRVDPTARIRRSILWDDIDIGARAALDECIVTDGVRVPPDATYRRTILWNDRGCLVGSTLGSDR